MYTIEWRLVTRYGRVVAEAKYSFEKWSGWHFPVSKEPKPHYKWNDAIHMYVRNTSID